MRSSSVLENGTRLSNIGRDVLNETRNLVRAADQLLERAQRVARGDIERLSILCKHFLHKGDLRSKRYLAIRDRIA